MNLNENPEIVTWPETHYLFIGKTGPFQDTASQAWQGLHAQVPAISEGNEITGYMSLYKIEPEKIYRAGVSLAAKPETVPPGFQYTKFPGGKYARFVLKGSFSNLPEACGRVFEIVDETKLALRDDFFIEHYIKDPRITPEDELITHILVPAG